MTSLLLLLLTQAPVVANQGRGSTDGGSWRVTCTNCSGSGGTSTNQGLGYDGGQAWGVYVINPSSGGSASGPGYVNALIDGGFVTVQVLNSYTFYDGGPVSIMGRVTTDPFDAYDGGYKNVYAFVSFDGGFVSVTNFPASQAVTNANLDVALSTRTKPADQQHTIIDSSASIAVTGPVTDTQLRASAVPVSLTSTTVTGSVAVTGPLTDTQLRASAVPISLAVAPTTAVTNAGLTNLDVALSTRTKPADQQHAIIDSSASIAVTGPITDTQIRATPLPVSGTVTAIQGVVSVSVVSPPLNPFLQRCNPVRRTNCQP